MESTGHDRFAARDYQHLQHFGIHTARESARWHLIESQSGHFDFATLVNILDAAERTGTEIILDLLHFGWPDGYDPFSPDFPVRFADFAFATARFLQQRKTPVRYLAAVNEISFLAWAGGEAAFIGPFAEQRGAELKRNLIRCAARASKVLLDELPGVRLVAPEPVIHVVRNPLLDFDHAAAETYRLSQFEAWDMLSGAAAPELGGKPEYLDILGVNFYEHNQWIRESERLTPKDPRYRPFRSMLQEVWQRYQRPMFVSETGTEDERRASWFDYICDEVAAAVRDGVPVHGICLYPILNHPGWDDNRHCCNGLLDYPDEVGNRDVHWPLAQSILSQQTRFAARNSRRNDNFDLRRDLPFPSPMGLRVPKTATSDEAIREGT